MIFWKVVLLLFSFFYFGNSWSIDHGPTDFGGYPKSFRTSPEKRTRGQDGDNEPGDLWDTVKVARASIYLICTSSLCRLPHSKQRREKRRRYLSCQCALSSRIFTTLKFHTHNNLLATGSRYY